MAAPAQMPLYFVCYSRKQKMLVEKIEAKLDARCRRGEMDVWRDERNLDCWERFTPAILDALNRAVGAIVVFSDDWSSSNYIQDHEWPAIVTRHQQNPSFKIFPLAYNRLAADDPLAMQNFINPRPLKGARSDVRDTVLTRLSELIGEHARSLSAQPVSSTPAALVGAVPTRQPSAPAGSDEPSPGGQAAVLDGVPTLPENFIEPAELAVLSAQLAGGSVTAISGVQGEGGTGKSVLAAAIAHRTAHVFSDRVFWVTVGEHATSEDVRRMQADLLGRLGTSVDQAPRDVSEGKAKLAAALVGQAVLVIIDDIWHPWQGRAFDIAPAGGQARVLFTTRYPESLPAGSTTTQMARLGRADSETFLDRLSRDVPFGAEDLPAILDAAGGLRLALAVFAATAKVEGSWDPVLTRLHGLSVRFGHGDDASSAQKALFVALDTLDTDDRRLVLELGAFPPDALIPPDLLADLWDVSHAEVEAVVGRLAAKDLVVWADNQLSLHDHVHDFLVLQAEVPASDIHLKLWELAVDKCRTGWGAFADENEYLWDRLTWHACRAGINSKTLQELASDLEWLAERIRRQGASAAEQDVGQICERTALDEMAPLSQLRRVLRHGGLFEATGAGDGLMISLQAWADSIGLGSRPTRRLHCGSLPVPSPALLQTLRGHSSETWGVAFFKDGRRLATCSEDRTARIWDIRTGQTLFVLVGHTRQVFHLALSSDDRLLATSSADETTIVWDTATGGIVQRLAEHTHQVWGAAFGDDSNRLATCSEDGTARLWDVGAGESLLTMDGGSKPVWDVALRRDGGRIATAGAAGTVCVRDGLSGEVLWSVAGHFGPARTVAIHPSGSQLLSGGDDSAARIWDLETGAEIKTFVGHSNPVWTVDFSPDGRYAATASDDSSARVWEVAGESQLVLTGHSSSVHGVAFSADGKRIATVGGDGTTRIWDAAVDRSNAGPAGLPSKVNDVALNADDTRVLAAVGDGTVRMWDTTTGQPIQTFRGGDAPMWGASWSPDERLIAGSSEDCAARIWDANSGEQVALLNNHTHQVWDVSFSYDGSVLATVSEDATARIWDTASGEELFVFEGHGGRIWEVNFSSDDRWLATGGDDGTARIWDMDSRKEFRVLEGHGGSVWDVAFTSDKRFLATASEDCNARIWDMQTGLPIYTLVGHTAQVWGVAFSSDDRYLASAGSDGVTCIWDRHTGDCVLTMAVACAGPMMWHDNLLALAAGSHWAVISLPEFGTSSGLESPTLSA